MTMLRRSAARIVEFFRSSRLEGELRDEIQTHLEMATEENVRRGMDRAAAALAARRSFGGVEQVKERYRDLRGLRWAHDLSSDLRLAARLLRKEKSFTSTALLTLAVCIGGNVAVFSVVDTVLIRPLPVPEPERLVSVTNAYPRSEGALGDGRVGMSARHYLDRLGAIDVLEEQALYQPVAYSLDLDDVPEQYGGLRVTPSFFGLVRVLPQLGRVFTEAESERGQELKVVISHAFWQSRMGGAANVIGRDLRLDSRPHEIVGVMPADFQFVRDDSWFWVPAVFSASEKSNERRHANNWYMLGRLSEEGTLKQAQTQIDALNGRDLERFPESRQLLTSTGFHTIVAPLQADMVRDVRGTLYLLWGGALFVLLIGCVNVANLTLIRATTRLREFGLRHALGAGRWRLARQLIGESLLLAVLGALLGVPLGVVALKLTAGLGVSDLPRSSDIDVDLQVALLAVASSVAIGLLLGLVSVGRVFSASIAQVIQRGGRSVTGDRKTRLVGSSLVVVQISTAFILLAGAFLMLVSLERVLAIDPGFNTGRLLTATVSLPSIRYPASEDRRAFAERAVERLRRLAGVEEVGVGSTVPFGYCCPTSAVHAEGMELHESYASPYLVMANSSYFEALGVPLVEGRFFDGRDTASHLPVVIIDEDLGRTLWPGESPLGRRVYFDAEIDDNTKFFTVVGVVASHAMRGLVESQAQRGVHYLPMAQHNIWFMTFAIRTAGDPLAVVREARAEMATLDPQLPLFDIQTMEERMGAELTPRKLPTVLASGFAVVALFLAALGIYGVVAYQVTQRRKEMAIRLAFGSTSARLYRLVISEGVRVLGVGLILGTAGAFLVRDVLSSQLYDVQVLHAGIFLAVMLLLGVATIVACALPARRALSIDPVLVLNDD